MNLNQSVKNKVRKKRIATRMTKRIEIKQENSLHSIPAEAPVNFSNITHCTTEILNPIEPVKQQRIIKIENLSGKITSNVAFSKDKDLIDKLFQIKNEIGRKKRTFI